MKTTTSTKTITPAPQVITKTVNVERIVKRRYTKVDAAYWNEKATHAESKISNQTPADFKKVNKQKLASNESYIVKHFEVVTLLLKHDMSASKVNRILILQGKEKSMATIHKIKCAAQALIAAKK